MRIFISHSMRDQHLINALQSIAAVLGIEPLIAEHTMDLQNTVTTKIENMILNSDLVLVILTREGFNSNFVQQEIGFAKGKKSILILVEQGYESRISGFIYGFDYVSVDPLNPQPALVRIHEILVEQKQKKEQQEVIGQLFLVALWILFVAALTHE